MKTVSGKELSKIGIGSFGVGGRGHRDVQITEKVDDATYVDALVYTLNSGVNFSEVSVGYAHGQSIVLLQKALEKSTRTREDFFITHSLYPRDVSSIETAHHDVASFHEILETTYADSTLVTQSLLLKFSSDVIYDLLHQLLAEEKTRYVSLSNASPTTILAFHKEFGDAFFAHEGHLSFEVRALQDKEVFTLCDQLGVQNIIWRPLRRNKTAQHHWLLVEEFAHTYTKTQNQIVLNWMCHLGYRPMVMSTQKEHIDENIASSDFVMESGDYERMTKFRPAYLVQPSIEWENQNIDDTLVELANEFERFEKPSE